VWSAQTATNPPAADRHQQEHDPIFLDQWYLEPWKKFAKFDGRARRKEFWVFYLCNTIFSVLLSLIDAYASDPVLFMIAVLLPSLAVGVRRMHDTDHRGWWVVVPVVQWVFACMNGTPGDNRFGTDPKRV
jgi:uncharacterized membrane protein YhaH (DUF805 family)